MTLIDWYIVIKLSVPCSGRKNTSQKMSVDSGSVYMGRDPFGTGTKLVRMSFVFTRDLVGSGTDRICYLVPNGSAYEGDPMWNRTVPV